MNTITNKLIVAGVLFLFTLISGFFVSQAGRPYNVALFTIHKLIAVATVILIAIAVKQLYNSGDAQALIELGVMVITGALFLALIVTGALLSRDIQLPAAVLKIHQVAPLLSLVSSAITLYLLANSKA